MPLKNKKKRKEKGQNKEALKYLLKNFNKSINKNFKGFNKQIDLIKKTFTSYQEPYCEINQSLKGMNIKIKLPEVKKKDVLLNIYNDKIELKAESKIIDEKNKKKLMIFYRTIGLPPCSLVKKAKAEFKKESLKIKIPFSKI